MSEKYLTNSARSKFASCPRAYQYAYVMRKRPAIESEALAFGTLTHKALEAWWSAGPTLRRINAVRVITESSTDPFQIATCRALMDGYDSMYNSQTLTTVAVEAEFTAPLMNPETGGTSKTWLLSGKIDAIAKDDSDRLVIIEHKTTSADIDITSDYWKKLSIDGQVSGYYLGARALGYDVQDCVYDVIRKPGIKPATVALVDEDGIKIVHDANGCRVRTKDGKKWRQTGSTDEQLFLQVRDETADEYEIRLTEDIQSRPERYFARKRVARTESDMQDYLFDMWIVGRNIADAERLERFSRNPNSCSAYGTCEYFPVCSGMANIDDPHMYKTTQTNPELGAI